MAGNYQRCDFTIHKCTDQQHLLDLPSFTQATRHTSSKPAPEYSSCYKTHHICSRSKAAILILFWNVVVGIIYGTAEIMAIASPLNSFNSAHTSSNHSIYFIITFFGVIATGQIILFPLGGLLADIKYGRYKIITFSQVKIALGLIVTVIISIADVRNLHIQIHLFYGISGIYILILLLGLSGFQSNAVQFGLDQLMDAPSKDLSLFLHWFVWTIDLGQMIAHVIGAVALCNETVQENIYITAVVLAVFVCALLIFSCINRRWFHCEPRTQNPYGMVYKVLNSLEV